MASGKRPSKSHAKHSNSGSNEDLEDDQGAPRKKNKSQSPGVKSGHRDSIENIDEEDEEDSGGSPVKLRTSNSSSEAMSQKREVVDDN